MHLLAWVVLAFLLGKTPFTAAQLSKPIAHDSQIDIENNKFLQRKPELDEKKRTRDEDEEIIASVKMCSFDLHLRWMTQVSSSVYASPIITDLFSDNKKEILVPSHVHYLEVLEAQDGASAVGWPAFHKSHLQGSPFMYDIDRDGILDIGIVTYTGEVRFYKDTGEKMMQTMAVPQLRVKKNWYVGLNPDPVDHSQMDVGNREGTDDSARDSKGNDAAVVARRLMEAATVEGDGQTLTDAAVDSFKVFDAFDDEEEGDHYVEADGRSRSGSRNRGGIYEEQDFEDEIYHDLYHTDYDADAGWEDEEYERDYMDSEDEEYIFVDSHVLSTPVVADIDADGFDELVVAVSYFFDEDFYARDDHAMLPKGIDTEKYLAGGVVVFDLAHRFVKWSTQLDMTTKRVQYAAFMTAAPSVLDIDKDGLMEIVVGNNAGFLYVLDSNGNAKGTWPKQMGSIDTRILVDDLNGDNKIEILAADLLGNVAMFDINGTELWERHVASAILSTPAAGDVTGNGELDIVFGTTSGHVYVLDAKTGQDRSPFPFRVHGSIHAPIAITRLGEGPGQQLVFMAFDGYLYVINGETACVDARDIGEDSYSMTLVDDVTGDGHLDLVVTTMNGNVYVFETSGMYHPLRTWTAEVRGTETLVSREDHVGIFASRESRSSRDIRGEKLNVRFSIVDARQRLSSKGLGPYNVTVVLKNVGVKEMNMGPSPIIGVLESYSEPGTYELVLQCPKTRTTALIQVTMTDGNKHEYRDEFPLSFHMHWHKFVKWMVVVPFTVMAMVAVFIKPDLIGSLPS